MPDIFDTYYLLEALNCDIQHYKSIIETIEKIKTEEPTKLLHTYLTKIAEIESLLLSLEEEIQNEKEIQNEYSEFDSSDFDLLCDDFFEKESDTKSTVPDQSDTRILELKSERYQLIKQLDHYRSKFFTLKDKIAANLRPYRNYEENYQQLASKCYNLRTAFDKLNVNTRDNSINEEQSGKLKVIQHKYHQLKKSFDECYQALVVEQNEQMADYANYLDVRRNYIKNTIARGEIFLDKLNHYLLVQKKLKKNDMPVPIPDIYEFNFLGKYNENYKNWEKCDLTIAEMVKLLKTMQTIPVKELSNPYTASPVLTVSTLLKDNVDDGNPPSPKFERINEKLKNYAQSLENFKNSFTKHKLIFMQYSVEALSGNIDSTIECFNTHKRSECAYKDRYRSNLFPPKPAMTSNIQQKKQEEKPMHNQQNSRRLSHSR